MTKLITLFLIVMVALALWGRFSMGRRIGRYCPHCGRAHPCGCPKGRA